MNDVLFLFISLSASGSILALILFMLKPLVKNRLSQTWQYYIWLAVILRLLLPLTPEISVVGEMSRRIGEITSPPAIAEISPGEDVNEEIAIPYAFDNVQSSPVPAQNQTGTDIPEKADYLREIRNNIWLLWLGVALVLFVHKAASYRSFVRFIRIGSGIEKITDEHILELYQTELAAAKINRALPLYRNDQAASPMLVGIIRPALIIPTLAASDDELRSVIRHELTHYKRMDFLYKWLVQITLCLHWFNPLVYLIVKQINKSCELSCDEAVIKHLGKDGRRIYGDALMLSLTSQGNYSNFVVSMTMSESGNIVKERLEMIVNYKKKSVLISYVTFALTILFLCGFTFAGAYTFAARNTAVAGESYISFHQTSASQKLSADMESSADYFGFARIDVVDDNGSAYQGIVYLCKGSEEYKKGFTQALEQLYAAYPYRNKIAGYLEDV
jgi:beta-lactamase regulating signal transducer with metallopeptidase domain